MEPRIAFFDVDDTLIVVNSMFRFLQCHLGALGFPPAKYRQTVEEYRRLVRAGISREEAHHRYYRLFADREATEVAAHGREWFRREQEIGDLFHSPVLAALREHQRSRDLIVLVSGTHAACLQPIAESVGADATLCTPLTVEDGMYTGEIAEPMIGEGKAVAARQTMSAYGSTPADCYAYGDHASDLPLLVSVGHPVVVGTDPVLLDHAARWGWSRLPGTGGGGSGAAREPHPEAWTPRADGSRPGAAPAHG